MWRDWLMSWTDSEKRLVFAEILQRGQSAGGQIEPPRLLHKQQQ